jgi:glycosyltransferase involved in cell wall biosynthesis
LKVGYLLDRYPVLTQTFVRLEIAELRRQGVEVEVFSVRAGDADLLGDEPVTVLRDLPGGKVRHLTAHLRAAQHPRRYLDFWRTVRDLPAERDQLLVRRLPAIAEAVTRSGVEHLHAHFGWTGAAVASCLASLTGLPWSFTAHGNDLFSQTRDLPAKLRRADRVVTVCEYNRRFLADEYGIEPAVVVCGVEVPGPWTRPEPDLDVVLVGRLVAKKGVDLLLAAAAQLPHVQVEVIGDGPLRTDLEAAAPPNVRFVGAYDHTRTLDRIAHARVLCLPARIAPDGDRDSMPLVVKEAMARGVPAVVTDVVGLPEVVDETCGWVVPPEDAHALARAIDAAVGDPAEASRRGAAGRERVLRQFTLAAEVTKLRRVFGERVPQPEPVG